MKTVLALIFTSAISMAQTAAPAATSNFKQTFGQFIPILLIFGIFYFLILRPQQKKMKLQQQFLTELKRGDMVVTNGGIIGTIKALSDKFVTLEIDDGVCMKMLRNQVLEGANNLKEEAKGKTT